MNRLVFVQVRFLGKSHAAPSVWAHKRSLSCVAAQVIPEVVELPEGSLAFRPVTQQYLQVSSRCRIAILKDTEVPWLWQLWRKIWLWFAPSWFLSLTLEDILKGIAGHVLSLENLHLSTTRNWFPHGIWLDIIPVDVLVLVFHELVIICCCCLRRTYFFYRIFVGSKLNILAAGWIEISSNLAKFLQLLGSLFVRLCETEAALIWLCLCRR